VGGVHFYFHLRLVRATELPPPWRTLATTLLIVAPLSFPASFMLSRLLDPAIARLVLYPIYIWTGVMLLLLSALLCVDLARGLAWLFSRAMGREALFVDAAQRLMVMRVIAVGVVGLVLVATVISVRSGLAPPAIKRVEVTLPRLPASLDGFTIVQLTDLHLGALLGGAWFQDIVQRTLALEPDLIAITGDLADASPRQLEAELEQLARLQAPQGIFFVTGNHEYFVDHDAWMARLDQLGIEVLHNRRVEITRGKASFDLAGVDDHEAPRFSPEYGPDVPKAMKGRDPARASVLLAHQPRAFADALAHDIGLVIAGHTHGGQIMPFSLLVRLQQPLVRGLHRRGDSQIYISEGTGFWGPPMRLGTRAEITLITLRATQSP
jgi:hypothetical protein